jgi:sterol desaturase/sphingolipid hydroxylase (fatty acid hydroxylase superfamily)
VAFVMFLGFDWTERNLGLLQIEPGLWSYALLYLGVDFLFYWPLALIGFEAAMIVPVVAVHLVVQFLPHTRAVKRLGFLETFLNCPTHHRVPTRSTRST